MSGKNPDWAAGSENFFEAGTLGEALQLAGQVLLKRLPPPLRLTLKRRVDIFWYVSH